MSNQTTLSFQENYIVSVWRQAVAEAENAVMRSVGTPSGGRQADESVEAYIKRVQALMDSALERYRIACDQLEIAEGRGD